MSLLLDALKKSGDSPPKSTGLSDLSLQEPPQSPAAPASASRAAGENLFAAKKKSTSLARRWRLGLIPSTLLIALLLGSGYGIYLWFELSPPSPPQPQRSAPPPAPVAEALPITAAPTVPAAPAAAESLAAAPEQATVTARNEDFDAPRNKPTRRPAAQQRAKRPANHIPIQSMEAADTITPALLDAYHAYQRGDYAAAAQGYRQVLGKDAYNRDALLGLAATAQQQGQDEAAQRYYRQLLVLDPRDPVAYAALAAYAPADSGNTESRLRQLLAGQPRSGALHFALGNLYAGRSAWSEAQNSYFSAYTLEPNNAQFAFNLAVSLDHLGQGRIAAQYYQQALQLDVSGNSGFDRAKTQQRLNELTSSR